MLNDIYDDRENKITKGFFHYSFWIIGCIMSILPPILMAIMKDLNLLTKDMVILGFITFGLGLGITLYRIGIIAINDITNNR